MRLGKNKYIVISPTWVDISHSLKKTNARRRLSLTEEDFPKRIGDTFILNIDATDLDYERDCLKMSRVFMERLHKIDKTPLILQAVTLGFVVLSLMRR